ncbi:N-acetylglucosamine-6-phosphate deacetylase [Swingsia samuiensis]|uniref:N-acetylglucosamine-6-phosphate deacetylase n=1 Tax=Swingsia samuiensis TaxID=1293412 RepID=A0A4Y6UGL9_9PROT|nr:N-acetylglucosamine-6-phosphate deacetylase [Swingsia samuiensis]QDH16709.1 N-acetylglucosamine-6-phosphate deacetylase [Swingsia samuiensis]
MPSINGALILPDKIINGQIDFQSHIEKIIELPHTLNQYILPGFIDCHVHGGNGYDTMDGITAIKHMSHFHMSHGTTTLLPTTITAPWSDIIHALHSIKEVMEHKTLNGPRIHGAHLEGPFINPLKRGAQPPFCILPTPRKIQEALQTECIKIITLAPEIEHAQEAMQTFSQHGIRVSLGHTLASYEETKNAICTICSSRGTPGATHLFNAMPSLSARTPGPIPAFLCDSVSYAELIFDNHHVHHANMQLALQTMQDRLFFVTDSMRGAGQPDGLSTLGGQGVFIKDGVARLENGTLAGSVLTLDQALRNAIKKGKNLLEAAKLVSTNAAHYLGLKDRGEIKEGLLADFTILNEKLEVCEVWINGQRKV